MSSGSTLLILTAAANQPPGASYATPDTRNSNLVLNFDAAATEYAVFSSFVPANYGAGGFTVTIVWASASATSGNVVWSVEIERQQDGTDTIASDSFASAQTVISAAPGTTGIVKYANISLTNGAQIDNVAAGEAFRIRVARVGADGNDTMANDAQLIKVLVKET